MPGGASPPHLTRGSVGAQPRLKTTLEHIKCRRTPVVERKSVFRETFITAYTTARTVTGHQLAKTAPVHYSVNSKAKTKAKKNGNMDPCSHYFFALWTEPFGTWDTASKFGTVPKNVGRSATPHIHNGWETVCISAPEECPNGINQLLLLLLLEYAAGPTHGINGLVIFSVKIHVKLSHRLAICRENVQYNRV